MNRSQIAMYGVIALLILVAALVLLRRDLGLSGEPDAVASEAPAGGEKLGTDDILASMRGQRTGAERTRPTIAAKQGERSARKPRQRVVASAGQLERIGQMLANANSTEEKMALLMELDGYTGSAVVDMLLRELDDSDSEVKLAVLAILADLADPAALPAVDKALADQDEEVRSAAVEVLGGIEEPGVCAPLLSRALQDDSEDVRDTAFSILDDKLPEEQNVVFAEAISSPHKDVRAQTVEMISFTPSHSTFEILIRGLSDPDPEIVDEVKWTLDYFVSEEFESYDQALAWWEKNKGRFDEELFEN